MRILLILAVALAATLLPGCLMRGRHGGIVAIIPVGHIHSDHCGHYYHRDSWYHHEGHHHSHGCGHHYVGSSWIIQD